ncbi:metallophosphatase [Salinimicrobium catena]|uniref:metallophosphatase n=1 Tax=Salinimicrobium catena TaxID=390640 RepID=UPI002FE4775E
MLSSQVNENLLRSLLILCTIFFYVSPTLAQDSIFNNKKISHSFYITANTGDSKETKVLEAITKASKNDKASSVLLLGNVTRENGYLNEEDEREAVKSFLRKDLLQPLRSFSGKIFLTPGENEWNRDAPQSIDDLESFLQDNSNSEFWPDDGCPIERESINDLIELVSVDSQWFLEDWDKYPKMNSDCDYKTREEFFTEFKDDLKDSHGKVIIVAVHHPVMSSSRIPFFSRITGASPSHFESNQQKELRGKLETLASLFEDVIFVSGNHRNLQYLYNGRNPQIISGAAAGTQPARTKGDALFTSAEKGYAKFTIFEDGSSAVQFFELNKEEPVYAHSIARERPTLDELDIEYADMPEKQVSSIYTPEETEKTHLYEWLWGSRYRKVYSQPIEAPVLALDSLRPISEGGGQQSRSLRLINDSQNEYTLRAMRKDPLQYLQADVVKTNFIEEFLQNTIAQRFVADFFTTAHPYAPFAVNDLSTALDIHHANPKIYYVPKQKGLDIFNEDYGNALFMLEEHVGDENKEFKTFGSPDNIISTADLLLKLRETKQAYVDQEMYLRARIFDMLIGDWDRHSDQWRWAAYNENGKTRYEPIPRDRDHAFSKYDGALLPIIKSAVPLLRKMQSYDESLKSVKWFNWSGYPLDLRFIKETEWEKWQEQVKYIQENLTDEVIEEAFAGLPKEVVDNKDITMIKENLKKRRGNLAEIARDYLEYLQEFQTITGTDEDDHFRITRKENGVTEVVIQKEDKEIFSKTYSSEETDEIWLYGLDGDDEFVLEGEADDLIELKIIGGYEEDTYHFRNPRKAKLYDYKSNESIITNPASRKWLVDSYDINQFHYLKRKYSENKLMPVLDYVTDAGFTLGVKDIYTTYGLSTNPFTTQYIFSAQYFFASQGYELNASAEFANVFYKWNFKLEGRYSSPNYFINYFGTGNDTQYDRDEVERRYNRVKLEQSSFKPSLVWRSDAEAFFSIGPTLETVQVKYRENTFLGDVFSPENPVFDHQLYAGGEAEYFYENKNNPSYPSLGSRLDVIAGYKQNIDENNNEFGYLKPSFSIDYPLIPSGFAVIATKVGGTAIMGDNYEFYHAATLGGNRSLRGYRNHRFNGKYSFYQSTDLRTALGLIRTDFIPLIVGVSAGFDYGRVWTEDDDTHKWHNNYGGSVWINGFYALTANIGYYHGGDGNRLTFTVNFKY